MKEILRNQYESQRMELSLCELGDWWMALWMGNPEYQLSYICDKKKKLNSGPWLGTAIAMCDESYVYISGWWEQYITVQPSVLKQDAHLTIQNL